MDFKKVLTSLHPTEFTPRWKKKGLSLITELIGRERPEVRYEVLITEILRAQIKNGNHFPPDFSKLNKEELVIYKRIMNGLK